MLDLLAIGEVMAEIRNGSGDVNSPDFSVGFAGDTYNTAVYCKRELGDDGKVGFMTRVGQDNLSLTLIKEVARHGLETAYIARDERAQIGIYSVSTSLDGGGALTIGAIAYPTTREQRCWVHKMANITGAMPKPRMKRQRLVFKIYGWQKRKKMR